MPKIVKFGTGLFHVMQGNIKGYLAITVAVTVYEHYICEPYNLRECITQYNSIMNHTTIVVHSRDNKGVSVAHEIKPPKNQPHFWLDTNKLSD